MVGVAVIGGGVLGFLHFKNRSSALRVGLRTKVAWEVPGESTNAIPEVLPVFVARESVHLPEMWQNILAYCGMEHDFPYTDSARYTTADWTA